jgi:hypothetical protein
VCVVVQSECVLPVLHKIVTLSYISAIASAITAIASAITAIASAITAIASAITAIASAITAIAVIAETLTQYTFLRKIILGIKVRLTITCC